MSPQSLSLVNRNPKLSWVLGMGATWLLVIILCHALDNLPNNELALFSPVQNSILAGQVK